MINAFDCSMCGHCCANQDLIQLTSYELFRLAEHLKQSPAELFDTCCELCATSLNPMVHMYIKTVEMRCPFLDEKLCSVHRARPYACRAYPMRQLNTKARSMKAFVREKYPMLEATCSLFGLEDDEELIGDPALLTEQTIAYMVDEIYFNTIGPETANLRVPCDITIAIMNDDAAREPVRLYLSDPTGRPLENTGLPGLIALMLQARAWGVPLSLAKQPQEVSTQEDPRIGPYLLAMTDTPSVDGLRALIEGGRMDLSRSFIAVQGGKARISAVYASSVDKVAIGFQIETNAAAVDRLSGERTQPVYIFFLPDDGSTTKAIGLAVNG